MNPADLTQTLEALAAFAKVIDALGIPGIIALIVSGPLLMLCSLYLIEYRRNTSTTEMVHGIREETRNMLEAYRKDTQQILRELGTNQGKTDTYYRDNVELVKRYERIAESLQDVVVSNTKDAQQILRELGTHQGKTDACYRDNVELVKRYERIAEGLQDVVVSNTRAMERLVTMLEERRKQQ